LHAEVLVDATFFRSPAEFRDWLEEHHDTAPELWVGFFKKGAGETGITYQEALDQALCFGWIDGVRKTIDATRYANRFTRRQPKSPWSVVNIERVGELMRLGLMRPPGLAAFEGRDEAKARQYSFERSAAKLDDAYKETMRANPEAWQFFQAQPPSYRRVATWWVMSAKREETRLKRLATLIADSERGRRLGQVTYRPRGRGSA